MSQATIGANLATVRGWGRENIIYYYSIVFLQSSYDSLRLYIILWWTIEVVVIMIGFPAVVILKKDWVACQCCCYKFKKKGSAQVLNPPSSGGQHTLVPLCQVILSISSVVSRQKVLTMNLDFVIDSSVTKTGNKTVACYETDYRSDDHDRYLSTVSLEWIGWWFAKVVAANMMQKSRSEVRIDRIAFIVECTTLPLSQCCVLAPCNGLWLYHYLFSCSKPGMSRRGGPETPIWVGAP